MKKLIIYIACTFAGWNMLSAQEILVQWTGVVRNELLQPVPNVHVIAQKDFRPAVSDPQGMFTIITYPRDTLLVSCIGFKPRKVPVPSISYEESKHYIKDIILVEDTIMLGELIILPWKTYKEFKDAFLALNLPEDDLQRAYRNIAAMQDQIYYAMTNRAASPTSNFRDVMNSRTNRMMTYGHMYPTYAITNPLAWAQFFQAVQRGDFKKKDDAGTTKPPTLIEEINQENQN